MDKTIILKATRLYTLFTLLLMAGGVCWVCFKGTESRNFTARMVVKE